MSDQTPTPEPSPEDPTSEVLPSTEEGTPEQLGLFGSESSETIQPTRRSRNRQAAVQRAGLDEERLDSYKALMASLVEKKVDDEGLSQAVGVLRLSTLISGCSLGTARCCQSGYSES
ncbi:MAG: hypothetical protein RBJ76_05860 [Stenomitos frigidus ULC029]